MFSYAVKSLPCRDEWVGWQDQSYKKHLERVVNNNRFLIFPWVKVTNLASKVLSMACRQLPDDWQRHHGYQPVLMETFVDPSQFNGTSYRAANWLFIGNTQPRSGKTQKQVYVYPLVNDFRSILMQGPQRSVKKPAKSSPVLPTTVTQTDPFVQLWQNILGTMVSVAAAAMCQARAKLDENVFKVLQVRILQHTERHGCDSLWNGHRIFAVDGSKLNLPRQLIHSGYRTPAEQVYHPQGLASTLYGLCRPRFRLTLILRRMVMSERWRLRTCRVWGPGTWWCMTAAIIPTRCFTNMWRADLRGCSGCEETSVLCSTSS